MEKTCYLAPNATIVGDVTLEENVNIWYGAVLRGDEGPIRVGAGSNIQDNCVLHETVTIGEGCTIGHGAIVHGCAIGSHSTVGMGAIVLNGAVIGEDCMVGAGALVTGKMNAPDASLILGSPAKIIRSLTPEEIAAGRKNAADYILHAQSSLTRKISE